MHVNGIFAQLANTIRLSDSKRSSILTLAEENFIITSVSGVLNRRDIDDIVQSFKTNAASLPRRHYVNAIFASREDVSPIISNVVGNDIENQVLETTAIPATTRATEITVATDSYTDFTTFLDVNFSIQPMLLSRLLFPTLLTNKNIKPKQACTASTTPCILCLLPTMPRNCCNVGGVGNCLSLTTDKSQLILD
jgi:hypothetical protein